MVERKRRQGASKQRFITDFEPAFPEITKILRKHSTILQEDDVLMKVFPSGSKDFQVCYRRGGKNMKEILAPSKANLRNSDERDQEDAGSRPCGKGCTYCKDLEDSQGTRFQSNRTGYSYRIRQSINCEAVHIVYLVTCKKEGCEGRQGVGQTKSRKVKISQL